MPGCQWNTKHKLKRIFFRISSLLSHVTLSNIDPAKYEAWYHTHRGNWIAESEFNLLQNLLKPVVGESLLDVGCGTGHFSRRFSQQGLTVTGIDPDPKTLDFARRQSREINYLQGDALTLPFPDQTFDCTSAITSFCFIDNPALALAEMWRVTRRSLILGLLNRNSLLRRQKEGHGSYRDARWVTASEVSGEWFPRLTPLPKSIIKRSAIFYPQGNQLARLVESLTPSNLLYGGFLAIKLKKL